MRYMSDGVLITLVFVLLLFSVSLQAEDWPVKRKIDLSSGFGDYRQNRFHTGVDIRTGGKSGESIYSPVDGYIHRIRTSYTGYGKGLYIKGDNGYIYVFAHLKAFDAPIDSVVKHAQLAAKRYYQDLYLPKDSLRVKKGDFLGYSGQTGAGAPHLHFEKRTADNLPLNPLNHDFALEDNIAPTFEKIGFKQLENDQLFDNGIRDIELDVFKNRTNGNYYLDTVLYFKNSFGIFTSVYDQMRQGGMRQTAYSAKLYIDDELYYESVFDTLNFDVQRSVNFEYEYSHAIDGEKRVRRLYHNYGNEYEGSSSPNNSDGIIGRDNSLEPGYHKVRIVAADCFGNVSTLHFDFIWTGIEELFTLDSNVYNEGLGHDFYFTPTIDVEPFKIDSVVPHLNRGALWGRVKNMNTTFLENGQLRCRFQGNKINNATIKLFSFSGEAVLQDLPFNGMLVHGKYSVSLDYSLLDDGLLVILNVKSRISSESRLEIYSNDSLLGYEYPRHYSMQEYRCFIPPKPEYKHIDKIGFAMSKDSQMKTQYRDSLQIYAIGYEDNQVIQIQDLSFEFNKNTVYKPIYVEVSTEKIYPTRNIRFESSKFVLLPDAFVCKNEFKLTYNAKDNRFAKQAGLAWLDESKDEWVWLETENKDGILTAASTGGGRFASLYDFVEPEVKGLSIQDGRTYRNLTPTIAFILEDDLSGIRDDQSILIRLNGEWMIPEYDPDTKQFFSKVLSPLPVGKHHLGIEVTDRAGNKIEQYLNFYVRKK